MSEHSYIEEKSLDKQSKSESLQDLKKICEQMEKSVCKIKCISKGHGTGFFCLIQNGWDFLRFLVTNYHVLPQKDIKKGNKIKFSMNNDKINLEIYIDESRITFANEKYDVTFIEIRPTDGIDKDSFLDIDNDIFKDDYTYKDMPIYLLHYPKGEAIYKASGLIQGLKENKFTLEHYCDSDFGSSGGPLICLKNFKVIGVHKGGADQKIGILEHY